MCSMQFLLRNKYVSSVLAFSQRCVHLQYWASSCTPHYSPRLNKKPVIARCPLPVLHTCKQLLSHTQVRTTEMRTLRSQFIQYNHRAVFSPFPPQFEALTIDSRPKIRSMCSLDIFLHSVRAQMYRAFQRVSNINCTQRKNTEKRIWPYLMTLRGAKHPNHTHHRNERAASILSGQDFLFGGLCVSPLTAPPGGRQRHSTVCCADSGWTDSLPDLPAYTNTVSQHTSDL